MLEVPAAFVLCGCLLL